MSVSKYELCELSLFDNGFSLASSIDLKPRSALRNPSGPVPARAKEGIIFMESRQSRLRPDPDVPSDIKSRKRCVTLRDAGLITNRETSSTAEAATAIMALRRLRF